MHHKWRQYRLALLGCLGTLLVWLAIATPGAAHWADLAIADITVGATAVEMNLTIPTGLVAAADDNLNGQLSPQEVLAHHEMLQTFLGQNIRLMDTGFQPGHLSVKPYSASVLPANLKLKPDSHSTLQLTYTWPRPINGLKIDYNLFLPNVPTARCLATISQPKGIQNVIFSPENRVVRLGQGQIGSSSLWATVLGAFIWGAFHSLSPGHGKTIVGAYLTGSRATAQHALFLGVTTTITHTVGVFALGFVALFASHYILPEQLLPWFSLLSGVMVVIIGLNLLHQRFRGARWFRHLSLGYPPTVQAAHAGFHTHHDTDSHHHTDRHSHDSDHFHSHEHHYHAHPDHDHGHHHHPADHSHLPPGTDGTPITWRSLLMLGVSGGLLPCPSALVLLLSAIALGQVGYGMVLVLSFSLGLAGVLTGLGLLLVYARHLFVKFPKRIWLAKTLPTASALLISLIGMGITARALWQISLNAS